MTIVTTIDSLVADQKLLDHPFYKSWSRGDLTGRALKAYAEQYFHWVCAFPTFLSAAHSGCHDLQTRQALLENLIDEERGPDNHPELWLRFCDALELHRDSVRGAERLPETDEAIKVYEKVCRTGSTVAALGMLYGYESQVPVVAATKRAGLIEHYKVTTGLDYFLVHETMDIYHSAAERRLIDLVACENDRANICQAVCAGLGATYTLLDGVYERYV